MLQNVARTLGLSPTSLYLLGIGLLLVLAFVLGSVLCHLLRSYGKKLQSSWGELLFSFLASLPTPLLIWLVLYVSLQALQLPRRYERLGSELLSALMALAVYFFPTQAIVLFLRRMAERDQQRNQVAQFTTFVVRSLFVLVAAYTVQEILTVPPRYERLGAKVLTALGIGLLFYALTRFVTLYIRNRVNCESGLWNACKRKASTSHSQYSGSSWTGRAQILATGRRPTATLPRRRPASVLKTQSARRPAN